MAAIISGLLADANALARLRAQAAADVQEMVSATVGSDTTFRPINATDTNNGTVIGKMLSPSGATTADVWSNDIFSTWTLTTNQALAIFGYAAYAAAPQIDEIRFSAGNVPLADIPLGELYANTVPVAYFTEALLFQPGEHVRMDILSHVGVSSEPFLLLGYVGEASGKTVVNTRPVVPHLRAAAGSNTLAAAGG